MKTITTPHGKVLVDESAEIEEGWIVTRNNRVGKFEKTDGKELLIGNKGLVIATINHSVSLDIPMVIVEDEIEKLALKENPKKTTAGYYDHWSTPKRKGFKAGFERAQQKGVYSEEAIELAIEFGLQYAFDQKMTEQYQKDKLKFIQSLNQEPIP